MSRPPLGRALLHPVALVALAVLVVNDHLLKACWPGFVTGKLSDFAGMVVAPLFLIAVVDALAPSSVLRREGYRAVPWLAAAVVGLGFAAAKTWAPATAVYEGFMEAIWRGRVVLVRDPGDLAALPMGVLAALVARRRPLDGGSRPLAQEGSNEAG